MAKLRNRNGKRKAQVPKSQSPRTKAILSKRDADRGESRPGLSRKPQCLHLIRVKLNRGN